MYGPQLFRIGQCEGGEAQRQHRVVERSAEVLPKRRIRSGIIRREQQREHVHHAANTGRPHKNSGHQGQSNRQLSVSHGERDDRGMGKHEIFEHRNHEGISPALHKQIDPVLKAAGAGELRAEDFVLGENQKKTTDCNSQRGERPGAGNGCEARGYSQWTEVRWAEVAFEVSSVAPLISC